MKKIFKKVITVTCAAVFALGLTACSKGEAVTAYELAKKNGFTGTEQEWLLSLKGGNGEDGKDLTIEDMYEAAKKDGFDGSMLEFIQSLGVDVDLKENNDTKTIAENVMSVVNVCCSFSKTTTSGGLFGGQQQTSYFGAGGAGVIVDLDKNSGNALIITNYHVIYDKDSNEKISKDIYVYGYGDLFRFSPKPDGEKGGGIQARYVGGAMDYDIALLKVEGKVDALQNKTEAKVGVSEKVRLGEKVFAIGNPKGEGIAVTSGVISVDSEYITMVAEDGTRNVEYRVMRTDAPINNGNSGGGLFNANGELIGITNAKYTSDETDNIAYALPITQVINLCDNIMANGGATYQGVVKRAMLGVTVSTTDSYGELTADGELNIVEEFSIAEVADKNGAAYKKFNVGDTFLSMQINNGEKVMLTRQYYLGDQLLKVRLGDTVTFEIRNASGSKQTVIVKFDKESYFTVYQ